MPRLKKAIASAYSPFCGRELDPGSDVLVTTGANEGLGAAMLAFVNPGEEILMFEPYFDQYLRYAKLCDAVVKPIALQPPAEVSFKTISSADWTFDASALEKAITPKTRAIVGLSQIRRLLVLTLMTPDTQQSLSIGAVGHL
jgi:kynurenine aminotransferase